MKRRDWLALVRKIQCGSCHSFVVFGLDEIESQLEQDEIYMERLQNLLLLARRENTQCPNCSETYRGMKFGKTATQWWEEAAILREALEKIAQQEENEIAQEVLAKTTTRNQ